MIWLNRPVSPAAEAALGGGSDMKLRSGVYSKLHLYQNSRCCYNIHEAASPSFLSCLTFGGGKHSVSAAKQSIAIALSFSIWHGVLSVAQASSARPDHQEG